MNNSREQIRPVTYGLALYFLLVSLDCLSIWHLGSILRIIAFIPLTLQLLELKRMRLRINGLLISHVLFWYLTLISILYSVNQDRTIASVITLTLNYFLILSLGLMHVYNNAEVALLKRAMLWSGWLTVLLMFVFSDFSEGGRLSIRFGENLQDQNAISGYFLYAFSYHWDCFFRQRRKRHLFLALVLFYVVLLTGSRGALIAYLITTAMYLFLFLKKSRHMARNIIIVCVTFGLLVVTFRLAMNLISESVSRRFTLDYLLAKGTIGRSRIWKYLWNHYKADPLLRMLFGHGYGTTSYVNQLNGRVAHNLYLDNLITLGIPGLLLQIIMQGNVLYLLYKQRNLTLLGCYLGMIGMCMSLSLLAYKPMWNVVLMAMIVMYREPDHSGKEPELSESMMITD